MIRLVLAASPLPASACATRQTYSLADGDSSRRTPPPRGYNSLRLWRRFSRLARPPVDPRSSSPQLEALARSDSALDSTLFVRHYSGPPSWFLLLPIMICLSSRGTLLFPDATVRTFYLEAFFSFGSASRHRQTNDAHALRITYAR